VGLVVKVVMFEVVVNRRERVALVGGACGSWNRCDSLLITKPDYLTPLLLRQHLKHM